MAFWNRKKKAEGQPVAPASNPSPMSTSGPAPLAPEAPLRLPVVAPDAPLIERDTLDFGVINLEGVAFRPVPLPELAPPFLNPNQPDLFGTPNWVFEYFLEKLRDAAVGSVEGFQRLLVVWRGRSQPHFAFVYTERGAVLPVWFDSDQLVPWLAALEGIFRGPCEIEAQLSGYKTRASTFTEESDLAEFIRANAPQPDTAGTSAAAQPTASAAPPPAATPPLPAEPQATALSPPKDLDAEAPFIERDGLEPASLNADSLAFRPIALPDLPAPFVDPERPKRFGEPNYSLTTLIEHLRSAVVPIVDDLELLLIHSQGPAEPHVAFAYTRDRRILPMWFEGQLPAWLAALSGSSDRAFALRVPPSGGHQSGSAMRSIAPDLATFVIESAPSRWRGLDDMPAKQQLLDDALAANSRRAEVDPAKVAETWRTLIDVTGAEASPPANDADIAAFEAATGLVLPPELDAMLRVHNGAAGAFGMLKVMGLDEMLLEWRGWKQIFDEWPLDELLGNSSSPSEEALGIYTTPRWIPLVDERTGNFAALDLAPGPQGSVGQIIYFGAEESDSIRVLATDLGDFLVKQLEYARAEISTQGAFSPQTSACFYLN